MPTPSSPKPLTMPSSHVQLAKNPDQNQTQGNCGATDDLTPAASSTPARDTPFA
jgi:hypothetical protein